MVFVLEDRTWFTGDFVIRRIAVPSQDLAANFQQALPLERLLFEWLPRVAATATPGLVARSIDAIAAALLGLAALEFGRTVRTRGVRLVALASVIAFGGFLTAFTGLGKASALLCALTALTGVLALRAVEGRLGVRGMGVAVCSAILLHRAGVLLIPCWLVVVGMTIREYRREKRSSRNDIWIGILAPVLALFMVGGRILHVAAGFDLPHHLLGLPLGGHPSAQSTNKWDWRLLDLFNLACLMVPAGFPIVAGGIRSANGWMRSRQFAVLLALLGPWVVLAAIATPQQGIFRDLDFFAPGMVAAALLCAWILCRLGGGESRTNPLLVAVTAMSVIATVQVLLCFNSPAAGLARVRAYLSESPRRPESERALTWDFLALRAFALGDWPLASVASSEAAQLTPHPRLLIMSGIARTRTRDYSGAAEAYSKAIERAPYEPLGWVGLAGIALRVQRDSLADSARAFLRTVDPNGKKAQDVRRAIIQYPDLWPIPEDPFQWASRDAAPGHQ